MRKVIIFISIILLWNFSPALDKKKSSGLINVNMSFLNSTGDNTYFSPNYDGANDTVQFQISVQSSNIITGWEFTVYNDQWKPVKQVKMEAEKTPLTNVRQALKDVLLDKEALYIPDTIEWDGISLNGSILTEGKYFAVLKVSDNKKNTGFSQTNTVILDVTPPNANVSIDDAIFSPNGDGRKDTFAIHQEVSHGDFWQAEIRDEEGGLIRKWEWGTNVPETLEWDGKNDTGEPADDGTYTYLLYGGDLAGNKTVMSVNDIHLNTKKTTVFLSLDRNRFSPNSDGIANVIRFSPEIPETNQILSWKMEILNSSNNIEFEINGNGFPAPGFWDGKNNNGDTVPDGDYYIKLTAEYENGNEAGSQYYPVHIDTAAPDVTAEYLSLPFSPDGDGTNDMLSIDIRFQDNSDIKGWILAVYNPDGKMFKKFRGIGKPAGPIKWNGRSETGELVESAHDYRVFISAEDVLGNKVLNQELPPVSIDVLMEKTEWGYKIRMNNIEFESGKFDLLGSSKPILNRVAEILKKYSHYQVAIQGHTDNIGSEKANKTLSFKRAQAVSDYLAGAGIAKERMKTEGFGFQYPLFDNTTDEGKRKNRRVEFILNRN